MTFKTLALSKENRIARVTLSRPEALNALSPELIEELLRVIEGVRDDPEVKALVITGQGRAFCAGADLKFIDHAFTDLALFKDYLEKFDRVMLALEELPIPTIAVVNGFALAGGLELLLSCDIAIAAEDATIGDQHINYALSGATSNVQLPRRIGLQRALELLLTGRWLSGKEAEEIGLVYKAVPREKLEEEVEKILSHLRDKSREAFAAIKWAAKQGITMSLRESFEYCTLQTMQYFSTSDKPKAGVAAFVSKKEPPKF